MIEPLLLDARAKLEGVPGAAVGRLVEPRGLLAAVRSPRIVRIGEAWPLGVLLLETGGAGRLWATGEVVRARPEDRRGYPAESARRRGELAAAASRGGFADGIAVQLPALEIDLAVISDPAPGAGPLAVIDGVAMVRWSPAAPLTPLAPYLDERIRLLLDPPARA